MAFFPPGTFDVPAITNRMKPQLSPEHSRPKPGQIVYTATFFREEGKESLYPQGPGPIAEVFELLRRACRKGRAQGAKVFEIDWRKAPPTPVSKAWDDE
jgi:hypothetical protein